ncbi:sensor histidine kinase [Nocardiopsis coralliicola]
MTGDAAATIPRLAALARLLLQVRMLLCAVVLFLIPPEILSVPTIITVVALALLSGIVARNWQRLVPYIRSHPLIVVLDVVLTETVLFVEGPTGPAFTITIISAAIAGMLYGARGTALVIALQILCYMAAAVGHITLLAEGPHTAAGYGSVIFVLPFLYPVSAVIGLRIRQVLVELSHEQGARRHAEMTAAAAEERNRLAREMHDSVAKTLRGASMAAQALPLWMEKDRERATSIASQIVEAADTASQQARELIQNLRDADDRFRGPLHEVITRELAAWSAASGHRTELAIDPNWRADPSAETRHETITAFCEALVNVDRHARATRVDVSLRIIGGRAAIAIEDDGRGFSRPTDEILSTERAGNGHFGLLGMSERMENVGGSVGFSAGAECGAVVTIVLPGPASDATAAVKSVSASPPRTSTLAVRGGPASPDPTSPGELSKESTSAQPEPEQPATRSRP